MELEKYLEAILKNQLLADDCEKMKSLRSSRDEIEELLTAAFSECNPTIRYGGSKAKNTLILESYDLDIICYFPHDDSDAGGSLKDIYENVKNFLQESYYVEQKNSALRIKSKKEQTDYHIDVVPGRFVDDTKTDAYLYQADGEKERLKTNLNKHIAHIRDSGLNDVIRLAKLWKIKTGLTIRTFVLELLVVKHAKKTEKDPLSEGLKSFWKYLAEHGDNIAVEDPANPDGNDLSEFLDNTTKQLLKIFAESALKSIDNGNWTSIYGEIEEMTNSQKAEALTGVAATFSSAPPKPWGDK